MPRQPEMTMRLTCDMPGSVWGDWLFAEPSTGQVRVGRDGARPLRRSRGQRDAAVPLIGAAQ